MLGKASAIKARNQVSEHPPLSKLAGLFLLVKIQQNYDSTNVFSNILHNNNLNRTNLIVDMYQNTQRQRIK